MRVNAQYCGAQNAGAGYGFVKQSSGLQTDDFIWWDDAFMFNTIFLPSGDGAVIGVLGHEYGHRVQDILGWSGWDNNTTTQLLGDGAYHTGQYHLGYFSQIIYQELNADCLEGVFLFYMYNYSGQMDGSVASSQIGDVYTRINSPVEGGNHGTTSQRLNAINYGYTYGIEGCRTGYIA